eukprot:scaffold2137_cov336-Prasinococcus_capsulatus_cf.AAC.2
MVTNEASSILMGPLLAGHRIDLSNAELATSATGPAAVDAAPNDAAGPDGPRGALQPHASRNRPELDGPSLRAANAAVVMAEVACARAWLQLKTEEEVLAVCSTTAILVAAVEVVLGERIDVSALPRSTGAPCRGASEPTSLPFIRVSSATPGSRTSAHAIWSLLSTTSVPGCCTPTCPTSGAKGGGGAAAASATTSVAFARGACRSSATLSCCSELERPVVCSPREVVQGNPDHIANLVEILAAQACTTADAEREELRSPPRRPERTVITLPSQEAILKLLDEDPRRDMSGGAHPTQHEAAGSAGSDQEAPAAWPARAAASRRPGTEAPSSKAAAPGGRLQAYLRGELRSLLRTRRPGNSEHRVAAFLHERRLRDVVHRVCPLAPACAVPAVTRLASFCRAFAQGEARERFWQQFEAPAAQRRELVDDRARRAGALNRWALDRCLQAVPESRLSGAWLYPKETRQPRRSAAVRALRGAGEGGMRGPRVSLGPPCSEPVRGYAGGDVEDRAEQNPHGATSREGLAPCKSLKHRQRLQAKVREDAEAEYSARLLEEEKAEQKARRARERVRRVRAESEQRALDEQRFAQQLARELRATIAEERQLELVRAPAVTRSTKQADASCVLRSGHADPSRRGRASTAP